MLCRAEVMFIQSLNLLEMYYVYFTLLIIKILCIKLVNY